MVYYVNAHLIADEVIGSNTRTTRDGISENFDRIAIKTAGGATELLEGKHVPTSIVICRQSVSNEPGAKTRVFNAKGDDDRIRTRMQTSVGNKYDDDAFVVAIPYDGLIAPMENVDPNMLAIYRYLIQKSSQMNIECNDRKYRRVVYFIVSPKGEAGADGWYPDECNLVLKTIKSNLGRNQKPNDKTVWTVTITTVRFGTEGAYEIDTATETVPYDTYAYVAENEKTPVVDLVPPITPKNSLKEGTGKPASTPRNGGGMKSNVPPGGFPKDKPNDTAISNGKKRRNRRKKGKGQAQD